MAGSTITVRDNGPLRISGTFTLLDAAGNAFEVTEVTALCRCGQSANKPFCDVTHRTCGFENAPRAGS